MTTVGIWGSGAEGLAAARAVRRDGGRPVVVDEVARARPMELDVHAIFTSGSGALEHLLEATEVIVSPGVPGIHPFRARLAAAGVRVTSLTDRWLRSNGQTTVGVTGTKGKSTTTTLIGLLLGTAGIDTQIGGNIGVPLADLRSDAQATVAELSSYQCASITRSPRLAVVTSLYEDHLTWHGSKRTYWEDKARIAGVGCDALVCDADTLARLRSIDADLPERVIIPDEQRGPRIALAALPDVFQLRQNLHNLQLAVTAADTWLSRSLEEEEILRAVAAFTPLPHRLERVAERAGVTWVDDTLSTVPESVIAAGEAFSGDLVLIVGGEERGVRYGGLSEYLCARDPSPQVITIPSNGDRIGAEYALSRPDRVHRAPSLEVAVQMADCMAAPGSTVVLSPGAPSYDRFRNFEHKSAVFVAALRRLDGADRSS